MRSATATALAALALASSALAQTFTECDPMNTTCPADKGLNSATHFADFTAGNSLPDGWSAMTGTTLQYGKQGAEFSISKAGQAPTITTDFYFFYGTVEIKMQAAQGSGIISSVVLESDDLDEIDFEFFGTGQYAQSVETNFFGKGNTTTYNRAVYYPMSSDPKTSMQTYTIDWSEESIVFSLNGKALRTLAKNDPLTLDGYNYPQTPMRLRLGNWAAGGPGQPEGTVTWAGGATTFDNAPYVMYVQSVSIKNSNPAGSYLYSDKSGSSDSIKMSGAISGSSGSSGQGQSNSKPSSTADAQPATSSRLAATGVHAQQSGGTPPPTNIKPDTHGFSAQSAANKAASQTASVSFVNTASAKNDAVSATSSPEQQTGSGATIDRITMAWIAVFTSAMCFWML